MTDYVPGAGDVEIELLGEGKLWLKPSLGACLRISNSDMGEPREIADQCLALNFNAVAFVIGAGLDRPVDEALQTKVFETGTINLFGKCLRFIHIISNGGRPPKTLDEMVQSADPLPTA